MENYSMLTLVWQKKQKKMAPPCVLFAVQNLKFETLRC